MAYNLIGKDFTPMDVEAKVTGSAKYAEDFRADNMAFCKTLTSWLGRIANYFVGRSSNGRTEGFNHGLRAILWRAFGMLNFRHFRLRVLDRFGRPQKT